MFFFSTAFAQGALQTTSEETQGGLSHVFTSIFEGFPYWIAAIVVLILSVFLARIIKKMVVYRVTSRSRYDFHQEVIILIDRAVYFTIIFLGLIISFRIIGIDIATLLGFIGLGLGFAFKDLLANFIAGVVILTQKKFMIGDTVEIDDVFGKIIEIETRTTQIQAFDGTIHIIPNSDMLTSVVRNTTKHTFRRFSFAVGVHYTTPLKEAVDLTTRLTKKHPDVIEKPGVQVLVTEFGDSAITLEVRFWLESGASWPRIMSEIMQAIKIGFDEAGIEIPFPIRTLTLDSFDRNLLKAVNLPSQGPARSGQSLLEKRDFDTQEKIQQMQQNMPTQSMNAQTQIQP